MNKEQQYRALVTKRKQCRKCARAKPPLINPASDFQLRRFDSDHIGPWTRWHHDLNAKVMVVGQDWGGKLDFRKQRGRDVWSPTNRRLQNLLRETKASLRTGAPPGHRAFVDRARSGLFFTNAMRCLRERTAASGSVNDECRRNCVPFLKRTIDIVQPRVVIALGKQAYISVLEVFGRKAPEHFQGQVVAPVKRVAGSPWIVPVFHPSPSNAHWTRLSRDARLAQWKRARAHVGVPVNCRPAP